MNNKIIEWKKLMFLPFVELTNFQWFMELKKKSKTLSILNMKRFRKLLSVMEIN